MALTVSCRVCGKEYTPCKNLSYDPNVFNWKEVACSADCGAVYLERIIASRQSVFMEKPRRAASRKKRVADVEVSAEQAAVVDTTDAAVPAEEVITEE